MQQLFTLDEVAHRLQLTVPQVRDLIEEGRLTAVEILPNELRVSPADLRRFCRCRRVASTRRSAA